MLNAGTNGYERIVNNSEMLQYTIDLGYFQFKLNGILGNGRRLRPYDAVRNHFEFKLKCTLPLPMLGFRCAWGRYIRLPWLESPCRHNDLSEIYFLCCARPTYCSGTLTKPGRRSHANEIRLRSLTTNNTRPDAMQPFLTALDKHEIVHQILNPMGRVKAQIIGNYYVRLLS